VFPGRRAVIFVHGCFWHGHRCHLFTLPATRLDFWQAKLKGNVERDKRTFRALRLDGWRVLTVWECALRGREQLGLESVLCAIEQFLSGDDRVTQVQGHRRRSTPRRR
jgi:DNA mismatch endonuclease, patch repair protein